jgi:hypothetical protein
MRTHSCEYTYVHSTHMSNFERLTRLNFNIYEVDYEEHLTVDEDIVYHKKNN